MKITQQEREQYKLECRARHFASQWLGGEPTASVDEFIECKKRAFCFRHNVKSVEFDKDFLDEFRQGVSYCQMWCMASSSGILFLIGNLFKSIDEFNAGYNIS